MKLRQTFLAPCLSACLALATAVAAPVARADDASPAFPASDDWPTAPKFGAHADAFAGRAPSDPTCQEFFDYSFMQKKPTIIRTESVLVLRQGLLEFEAYQPGSAGVDGVYYGAYKRDTPHVLFSASKSVTSALVAAAVQQNKLTLDTHLADFFPADANRGATVKRDDYEQNNFNQGAAFEASYSDITIRHLVEMSASMFWNESYSSDPSTSSVMRLLYAKGINDMVAYAVMQPMVSIPPDQIWNYSSGNMSLVMGVLHKIYGDGFATMPWDLLFTPLGFKNAVFERDGAGTFVGSSYVHLRPIDMVRFGYLYLNNGNWNGTQVIPADWVAAAQNLTNGFKSPATKIENATLDGVYGRTWWLNKVPVNTDGSPKTNAAGAALGRPYPLVPDDFYGAFGHYGQYIFVIPSLNMVIVRTAQDRDPDQFDVNHWVSEAIKCFQ